MEKYMVNYAAFDFGSNSTRILIASVSNGKIDKIIKKHIVTRMAEGTSSSKVISQAAIKRVSEAVGIFFENIMTYKVEEVFAIGTSAMRDSVNSIEVKKIIEKDFGLDIEIISGIDEAKLTLAGALYGFDKSSSSILFDIGGGSTEVIYSDNQNIFPRSYQLGVVRITDEVLQSRPIVPKEEKKAMELIDALVSYDEGKYAISDSTDIIGTSGTFTSLAAISLGLGLHDSTKTHLHTLDKKWLESFYDGLKDLSPEEINNKYKSLDPGRATTITPGTLIAIQLMKIFKITKIVVSENDILEGLFLNKVLN